MSRVAASRGSAVDAKACSLEESSSQVQALIQAEEVQLALLEQQLGEAHQRTTAAVGLLDNFDKRVDILEKSMMSLNESVKPMRLRQSNITAAISEVFHVLEQLNMANEVEAKIRQGPSGDYVTYSSYMARLTSAEDFLSGPAQDFKSSPKVLAHVRSVEKTGIKQCDAALVTIICRVSTAVNPLEVEWLKPSKVTDAYESVTSEYKSQKKKSKKGKSKTSGSKGEDMRRKGLSAIAADKIQDMRVLLDTMRNQRARLDNLEWKRQYKKSRSRFLLDSVKSLKIDSVIMELNLEHTMYIRGSHPFLYLLKVVAVLITGEFDIAQRGLGITDATELTELMDSVCEPTVSYLLDTGANFLHLREYAREFQHFAWLDVLHHLTKGLTLFERTVGKSRKNRKNMYTEIISFCSNLRDTCKNALESFVLYVRASANQPARSDCNVSQLTSTTLSYIKHLFDYLDIIVDILPCPPSHARTPQLLIDFICDTIDELVDAMKIQASHIDALPSTIFLINNSNHILKSVKEHEHLSKNTDSKLLKDLTGTFDTEMSRYRTCWNPCIECLLDTKSRGKASTWSASKFKQRVTTFNDAMEELYSSQQQFVIPDKVLREKLISEIRLTLMPLYESFLDRMRIVVPVDKMDKYVKFSPTTLGKMFDHILAGSEPAKANPRKVGLNKMLKPYLEYF